MSVPTTQAPNHLFHKVIVVVDDDEEIGTIITELINEHTSHEVQRNPRFASYRNARSSF